MTKDLLLGFLFGGMFWIVVLIIAALWMKKERP